MMRDKIGIVAGQGQYAKWFIDNGFKHFRVSANWALREYEGDAYLQPLLYAIKAAGGSVLADVYALPARLDPTQPLITRWSFPSIAIFKDEFTVPMQDDLFLFLKKWGEYIDIVSVATETNQKVWVDPVTLNSRSMDDYIKLVIRPLKEICNLFNKPLLGGSPTLRGDNSRTFRESVHHFQVLQQRSFGLVDHLDFHAYRSTAGDVIGDIEKFLQITQPKTKLWMSEGFGFNGRECFSGGEKFANFWKYGFKINRGYSPEQRQLRNYKQWLQWLKGEERIRRAYHYAAGGVGGDSLLKANGMPTFSATHLKEALGWQTK